MLVEVLVLSSPSYITFNITWEQLHRMKPQL